MTQLGDSGKPTYSYFAYDGSTQNNQAVQKYTAPVRMRIVTLGAWIGGWNEIATCVLGVWAADGTLLGRTAEFNVANEGEAGDGKTSHYTADLITPVVIDEAAEFFVGASRDREEGAIWNTGSTAELHYKARAAWPDGNLGSLDAAVSYSRRIGAYIVDYQPVGIAYVRRSGVWEQSESVMTYSGGAWVQVSGVQVMRSSLWVDAE